MTPSHDPLSETSGPCAEEHDKLLVTGARAGGEERVGVVAAQTKLRMVVTSRESKLQNGTQAASTGFTRF